MPTKVKGTTGVDKVEAGAVITNPAFSGDATVSGSLTVGGVNVFSGPYRNLIINGDMRIDQRNAGASVSLPSSTVVYPSDRFYFYFQMGASNVTTQQVSDAPTDFQYSSKITVGTGDTATASEVALFRQLIEGNNVAHLKCGTSDAKTVTLSFWVKSSLTGIYGIGVRNSASNRNYVMTYSISSANTWEKKTLTFTNDTAGTWLTDNGIGLTVTWDLGSGSDWQTATPETWDTAGKFTTSSQANLIGTSGATWQITGVQLEVGEGASNFEFLPYDVQLQRCQRYYEKSYSDGVVPGTSTAVGICYHYIARSTPNYYGYYTNRYAVTKRANASVTLYSIAGTAGWVAAGDPGTNLGAADVLHNGTGSFLARNISGGAISAQAVSWHFVAEAEL